jgi:flagellar protein FliS
MSTPARDAYLTTQVMTATPQKLQLLLIDAALRSAQLGQRHWAEGNDDAACDSLAHAIEVVAEMMASVGSAQGEISRRLSSIYIYLFRCLTDAQLLHNEQRLADAIRVLMIERETWSLVCEKFGATQATPASTAATPTAVQVSFDTSHEIPLAKPRRNLPMGFDAANLPAAGSGVSFEA